MRITPLVIAKRNLIEAYYNRSVIYSVFFPVVFLLVYIIQNSTTKLAISTQVPGSIIGLAFVLGSLDDALLSISRERDEGTLAKLFLSPVSRWSIIGGRILSSFILGIFKATLVFLLALTNFLEMDLTGLNLYIGLASFYALSSLTILLTVLLGLICSALFRAFKITVLLASSVILIFTLPRHYGDQLVLSGQSILDVLQCLRSYS